MPYFYDQNLLDQEKDPTEANQVQISGASPTTDSSGEPTQGQTKKELNTGSGFQNLDKYLATNQSQNFGNQVLGKVSNEIQGAQKNQQDASKQFKEQVTTANSLPTSEQVNQALANPAQANAKEFQKWGSQSYSGPKSLGDSQANYNQFWSGVNKANTEAKMLGSEPGRFSLLDSYFGKPSYSYGQKSLDNLLIQQSGLGQQTQDLQKQAAQLKSQGKAESDSLQNFAAQRAGEVENSRKNTLSAIGLNPDGSVVRGANAGALGKQYQAVEDAVANQNTQRHSEQQALAEGLRQGSITKAQAEALGIENPTLYDLNLNDYLSMGADLTKDQVMTPEQRAYIQALSDLAGTTDNFAGGTGQAPARVYTFDNSRFTNDVGAKANAYANELNQAVGVVKNNAPLAGDVLNSYSNQTNPANILKDLNNEVAFWNAEKSKGNPYADTRLGQLRTSTEAISNVLNKFGINPDTGSARYLRTT
jgi:hypothetical protein